MPGDVQVDVHIDPKSKQSQKSFRKNLPGKTNPNNQPKKSKQNKLVKVVNRLNAHLRKRKFAITNNLSFSDLSLEQGVHEAANSFFFPSNGVFRGQAKSFEVSGLATIKGSIIVSNAVGASNIFAFRFAPAACNETGWLQYGFGATIAAALANSEPAIISTTQAEAFRAVGSQLTLTPQGSLTNQAGSGITGYVTDVANFTPTSNNIANLRINRPFKAVDTQVVHWLPSENSGIDETEFQSITGSPPSFSEIIGYITIPTASDLVTSWQLDYLIGIEYLPSPAYRPFVDLAPPCQDMRSMQFVNKIAWTNRDPLMIGTIQNYEQVLMQHDAIEGNRNMYQLSAHSRGLEQIEQIAHANNAGFIRDATDFVGSGIADLGGHLLKKAYNAPIEMLNQLIPGTQFDFPVLAGADIFHG